MLGGIKGASSSAGLSTEGSALCAASGCRRMRWHYLSGTLWGVGVPSFLNYTLTAPFLHSFSAGELEALRNLLVKW